MPEISLFEKHLCYINTVHSEFLLCCEVENKISCYRKNEKFDLINNFTLYLTGSIPNLIITVQI